MIRKAIPADIESITAIYNEAIREGGFSGYLDPLSIENRRNWLAGHQDPFAVFVKTLNGPVVGYVALSPYRGGRGAFRETCEISYYFASRHRGIGLGKETILHAVEQARLSGFRMMVAMILASNRRSIAMLERFEFSISGRIPNGARIDGTYIDHLYLSRDLTP
jgi:L-amino acid N-acyltransferase YncA